MNTRACVASVCGVTTDSACRSAARNAASASPSRPRADSSEPRAMWTIIRAVGSASARITRSTWSSQRSPSWSLPCQTNVLPSVTQAAKTIRSSLQPCRRASSIACRLRSIATANDRSLVISAQCPRALISRNGRLIWRASAAPCSRCRSASSTRFDQSSPIPRLIKASARRSSPTPRCDASGAPAGASRRCASSTTAGRLPRRRARDSRRRARVTSNRPRRSTGNVANAPVATARCRSAPSRDPWLSSSYAISAVSSASAATVPAENPARSSCAVAPCPLISRLNQTSESRRAARLQFRAACAWRIASIGYPCSAYLAALSLTAAAASGSPAEPRIRGVELATSSGSTTARGVRGPFHAPCSPGRGGGLASAL